MNRNPPFRMCSMFASDPVSRLSTQMTSLPALEQVVAQVRAEKPAPPVTREVGTLS